jgi:recombination protein RecT
MTEPSNAVAKRDTGPGALVKEYSADFALVLPPQLNDATFVRLAQGVLRRDPKLAAIAKNNPGSLMQALLECARLGHEPGTSAFWLIPVGGEIEGWEGYRGVIQRMYRSGQVAAVKAEIVKEKDVFNFEPAMPRPDHRPDWFGERGRTIGAYAYAELVGGSTSRVVVINQEYIDKVKAMSKSSDKPISPWKKWEDAMVLKTALHRLEAFVPTSSEDKRHEVQNSHLRTTPVDPPTGPLPVQSAHFAEMRDDDADLSPTTVEAEVLK